MAKHHGPDGKAEWPTRDDALGQGHIYFVFNTERRLMFVYYAALHYIDFYYVAVKFELFVNKAKKVLSECYSRMLRLVYKWKQNITNKKTLWDGELPKLSHFILYTTNGI